ncbi:MAG: S-layer homology domain-containing protein [Clostridiales bacterium]|nr:S-layer homology domain-containing protein [Clostridiales bacterium]
MRRIISLILAMCMVLSMNLGVFANGENDSILSADYNNTFVIKDDGSLWGWGAGYVGNGTDYKDVVMTPVKVLENVRSVSSNARTTIAVKKDDTLWGWGSFSGYLDGKQNPTFLYPTQLLSDVKSAANGDNYMMVIKNDNTLWISGSVYLGDGTLIKADRSSGFVQVMTGIKSCFAGEDTLYVIKEDDTLWGWGDNSDAQLGNMTNVGDTSTDAELTALKILDDVKSVYQSGSVVLAIRLDGSLYSWGDDKIYTENGWIENAGSPYKVMDNVLSATMCDNGSGVLVVKTDGTLWGWDAQWYNEGKQMTPYKYADDVSYVSNGERHAAIIKKDNTLWTMGGNYRKGLGYESDETWYTPMTKILDDIQDAPASWAMTYVEKAIGLQLVPEDMQGDYYQTINREEFCILAVRLIEKKSNMSIEEYIKLRGLEMVSSDTFTDTNNKVIFAAKTLGITEGTSETTFSPEKLLTREQAATFLSNTAKAIGEDITSNTPTYADLDEIADWAKPFTGYVYNIDVMRGVGNNKFDPKGGYQRQQAYITMYKLFDAIDEVSREKVVVTQPVEAKKKVESDDTDLESIKSDLKNLSKPQNFTMTIEGSTKSDEYDMVLKYDAYYRNSDVRIDTYWDDMKVSKGVYNESDDQTYFEYMRYTHYAELIEGNMLPIRLLDVNYLEALELDTELEFFTANYEILDGEKVLYLKSSIKNGLTTEMWYSLKYLVPLKFIETSLEEGSIDVVEWQVVSIDEEQVLTDELFEIPEDIVATSSAGDYYEDLQKTGSTRDLLLYEVSYIETEEIGIMDMTQIVYYSDESIETLSLYFDTLLKDTAGYSNMSDDRKAIIEGTLNEDTVIVIVNNHIKYDPITDKNSVNVNYYKE